MSLLNQFAYPPGEQLSVYTTAEVDALIAGISQGTGATLGVPTRSNTTHSTTGGLSLTLADARFHVVTTVDGADITGFDLTYPASGDVDVVVFIKAPPTGSVAVDLAFAQSAGFVQDGTFDGFLNAGDPDAAFTIQRVGGSTTFHVQRMLSPLSATEVGGGGSGARTWFSAFQTPADRPSPASLTTGSGVVRNVATHIDWVNARAAAQPGDVINVTGVLSGQNERNAVAEWDCRNDGSPAPKGTAANPIVITCSGSGSFNSPTSWAGGQFPSQLDLLDADHVHVVGFRGTGGQFGLRCISSGGASGAPLRLEYNEISGVRDASLYVGDLNGVGQGFQGYISIKYNHIHSATGTVDFEEGIYIGSGSYASTWADQTHDVEVAYNEIEGVRGDGIDIKIGCLDVHAHHNLIHDIGAALGAGITSGATSADPSLNDNPTPGVNAGIIIEANWIWNIGYGFTNGRGQGIIATKAGTIVRNNVIWNLSTTNSVGIETRTFIEDGSFPIAVYNNTIWCNNPVNTGAAGGTAIPITFTNNIGPVADSTTAVVAGDFVGPVPASNANSASATNATADAGDGPGSGFVPDAGATSIVGQATGTTATVDITGVSRPQGGASERGAYELIPA